MVEPMGECSVEREKKKKTSRGKKGVKKGIKEEGSCCLFLDLGGEKIVEVWAQRGPR